MIHIMLMLVKPFRKLYVAYRSICTYHISFYSGFYLFTVKSLYLENTENRESLSFLCENRESKEGWKGGEKQIQRLKVVQVDKRKAEFTLFN